MSEEPTLHIASDGTKRWSLKGQLHRDDGPAIEFFDDGTKEWWNAGWIHRDDGPAIEYPDGTVQWILRNREIKGDELDIMKMRIWIETGKNYF